MSSKDNGVSIPVSFPVDTPSLASELKRVNGLISTVRGVDTPLFSTDAQGITAFTKKLGTVEKGFASLAKAMLDTSKTSSKGASGLALVQKVLDAISKGTLKKSSVVSSLTARKKALQSLIQDITAETLALAAAEAKLAVKPNPATVQDFLDRTTGKNAKKIPSPLLDSFQVKKKEIRSLLVDLAAAKEDENFQAQKIASIGLANARTVRATAIGGARAKITGVESPGLKAAFKQQTKLQSRMQEQGRKFRDATLKRNTKVISDLRANIEKKNRLTGNGFHRLIALEKDFQQARDSQSQRAGKQNTGEVNRVKQAALVARTERHAERLKSSGLLKFLKLQDTVHARTLKNIQQETSARKQQLDAELLAQNKLNNLVKAKNLAAAKTLRTRLHAQNKIKTGIGALFGSEKKLADSRDTRTDAQIKRARVLTAELRRQARAGQVKDGKSTTRGGTSKRTQRVEAALRKEALFAAKAAAALKLEEAATAKVAAAAKVAAKALTKEQRAAKKLKPAIKKAGDEEETTAKKTKKMSAASRFAVGQLTRLSRVVAIVQGPLGPLAGRLTAASSALHNMGVIALGAGLIGGGLAKALRRAVPAAIELQRTMSTLEAATVDSSKSFTLVLSEARRTGKGLNELASAYAQLAAAARGTSLQGAGIAKVFHAINTAGLALRLDVNQTKGAMKALEQMISKGTVSSEEMRQQLGERLPGAFRLAADSMGKTTSEFSKLLATGKIMAEDFLPKFAAAIEKAYGTSATRAAKTLGVALDRLNTEVTNFYSRLVQPSLLNSFSGFIDSVTAKLKDWGDAIAKLNESGFSLADTIVRIVKALTNIVGTGAVLYFARLGLGMRSVTTLGVFLTTGITSIKDAQLLWSLAVVSGVAKLKKLGLAIKATTALMVKNPVMLALMATITVGYAAFSVFLDHENAKLNEKISRANDHTVKGMKKAVGRLSEQILATQKLIQNQKYELNDPQSPKQNDSEFKKTLERRQTLLKKLLSDRLTLTKVITITEERQNKVIKSTAHIAQAYAKTMADADALIKKTLAPKKSTFQLNMSKGTLAKLKEEKDKIGVLLKAAATPIDRKSLQAELDVTVAAIAKSHVQIAAIEKIIKKEKSKAVSAARKAAAKTLRDNLAAGVKLRAAKIATANIAKKLTLDEGSRERLVLEQSIAMNALVAKQKIALIHTVGTEKRKALVAVQANVLKELSIKQAAALVEKGIAIQAAKDAIQAAHEANNVISLMAERRARRSVADAAATQKRLSDLRAGAGTNNAFSSFAERDRRVAEDFAAAKAATEEKFQLKIAAAQKMANAKVEIAVLEAARRDERFANELDRQRAHNEALIQLEQDKNSALLDLKAVFQQEFVDRQQINLGQLLNGATGFADQLKNIQDLGDQAQAAAADHKFAKSKALEKEASSATLSLVGGTLDAVAGLMNSKNRKAFAIGKAAAIGSAIVHTYGAVNKALDSGLPPPANFILAGVVGAAGLANVMKIASTKFGGGSAAKPVTPSASAGSGTPSRVPFNPTLTQRPTTPGTGGQQRGNVVQITQHITAPNSQPGQEQAIAAAAQIATHQALAAVNQDFSTNGPLRQQLAV